MHSTEGTQKKGMPSAGESMRKVCVRNDAWNKGSRGRECGERVQERGHTVQGQAQGKG